LSFDNNDFQRFPVSPSEYEDPNGDSKFPNENFQRRKLSFFTLAVLLLFFPLLSLPIAGNYQEGMELLADSPIAFIYLPTMVTHWLIFLLIFLTVRHENTGLRGLGFKRIRLLDILWAGAFLLVSNLILSLLSLGLEQFGLGIPGEIELMLPDTGAERIVWVFLSLTAGICEETAFRGYLITRLKLFGKSKSWIIPLIISSLVFGIGHTYQGVGGFIMISIYGLMFGILYIKTGSIWPCVIAHFFQDFSALFFPFQN
jgi:membrane protease YdiL (CAAX protease family)